LNQIQAKFLAQGHDTEIFWLTSPLAEIKPTTVWLQAHSFNLSPTPLGETSVIWCNDGNK